MKKIVFCLFLLSVICFGQTRTTRPVKVDFCPQVVMMQAPNGEADMIDIWVASIDEAPLACGAVDISGDVGDIIVDPDGLFSDILTRWEVNEDGRNTIVACTFEFIYGWARLATVQSETGIGLSENFYFGSTVVGKSRQPMKFIRRECE